MALTCTTQMMMSYVSPMNQHTSLAQPEIAAPSKTEVALLRRLDIYLSATTALTFFI